MSEQPTPPADAPRPKRPWSAPRVVTVQAAFEHSILACNGVTGRSSANRQPKGSCAGGGTALS